MVLDHIRVAELPKHAYLVRCLGLRGGDSVQAIMTLILHKEGRGIRSEAEAPGCKAVLGSVVLAERLRGLSCCGGVTTKLCAAVFGCMTYLVLCRHRVKEYLLDCHQRAICLPLGFVHHTLAKYVHTFVQSSQSRYEKRGVQKRSDLSARHEGDKKEAHVCLVPPPDEDLKIPLSIADSRMRTMSKTQHHVSLSVHQGISRRQAQPPYMVEQPRQTNSWRQGTTLSRIH